MDTEEKVFLTKLILSLIAITAIIMVIIVSFEKSQVRKSCEVFSLVSGRETKYVEYTFWKFDCLTPQNGGWISSYNLIGIE
jgi:hypothetical protein